MPLRRHILAATAALAVLLAAAACQRAAAPQGEHGAAGRTPSTPAAISTTEISPTTTPIPTLELLRDFGFPIAGACLPQGDQLMPNARRDYRNGVHEGLDFYASDNCNRQITRGTKVLAAKAGRVVRADLDYRELTASEVSLYEGRSDDEALDRFRGRQVWIDHGNGIVTRYCHLSGIAPDVRDGITVAKGQVIGYVGESGTPESVTAPGTEYHLHFEVRVGPTFLGKGLPPDEVRALYLRLFAP